MQKLKSIVGIMSIVAIVEGFSFLFLLFIGMPLKYIWEMPTPNYIGGAIHGGLFIAYILLLPQQLLLFLLAHFGLTKNIWKGMLISGLVDVLIF
jgi:integral membrane protein